MAALLFDEERDFLLLVMVVWFGFVHHLSTSGESFLQRYNKDMPNYSIYLKLADVQASGCPSRGEADNRFHQW